MNYGEKTSPLSFFSRKKSQSILEMGILASIFLFALGALVNIGMNLNYQQSTKMRAFRGAMRASKNAQRERKYYLVEDKPSSFLDPSDRSRTPYQAQASFFWRTNMFSPAQDNTISFDQIYYDINQANIADNKGLTGRGFFKDYTLQGTRWVVACLPAHEDECKQLSRSSGPPYVYAIALQPDSPDWYLVEDLSELEEGDYIKVLDAEKLGIPVEYSLSAQLSETAIISEIKVCDPELGESRFCWIEDETVRASCEQSEEEFLNTGSESAENFLVNNCYPENRPPFNGCRYIFCGLAGRQEYFAKTQQDFYSLVDTFSCGFDWNNFLMMQYFVILWETKFGLDLAGKCGYLLNMWRDRRPETCNIPYWLNRYCHTPVPTGSAPLGDTRGVIMKIYPPEEDDGQADEQGLTFKGIWDCAYRPVTVTVRPEDKIYKWRTGGYKRVDNLRCYAPSNTDCSASSAILYLEDEEGNQFHYDVQVINAGECMKEEGGNCKVGEIRVRDPHYGDIDLNPLGPNPSVPDGLQPTLEKKIRGRHSLNIGTHSSQEYWNSTETITREIRTRNGVEEVNTILRDIKE